MFKFPRALRSLFANILTNCDPKYPIILWEKHKEALSLELRQHFTELEAEKRALFLINQILLNQDKSLADFEDMPEITQFNVGIEEEIYDPKEEYDKAKQIYSQMNSDQKSIFDEIYSIINSNNSENSNCFYIDGPGGTGKSFLLAGIYHLAHAYKKRFAIWHSVELLLIY